MRNLGTYDVVFKVLRIERGESEVGVVGEAAVAAVLDPVHHLGDEFRRERDYESLQKTQMKIILCGNLKWYFNQPTLVRTAILPMPSKMLSQMPISLTRCATGRLLFNKINKVSSKLRLRYILPKIPVMH